MDFEAKVGEDRELIFETGGAIIGQSVIYEVGNQLAYRADGNGSHSLAVVEYTLTQAQLGIGELAVAWTYEALNATAEQTVALYLDGEQVGSVSMDTGGDWSGANGAAFGVARDAVADDGQNHVQSAADFSSGSSMKPKACSSGEVTWSTLAMETAASTI